MEAMEERESLATQLAAEISQGYNEIEKIFASIFTKFRAVISQGYNKRENPNISRSGKSIKLLILFRLNDFPQTGPNRCPSLGYVSKCGHFTGVPRANRDNDSESQRFEKNRRSSCGLREEMFDGSCDDN